MPPVTSTLRPEVQPPSKQAKESTQAGSKLNKPDQATYNAEQEDFNKQIEAVKVKLVSIVGLHVVSLETLPVHAIKAKVEEIVSIRNVRANVMARYRTMFVKSFPYSMLQPLKTIEEVKSVLN